MTSTCEMFPIFGTSLSLAAVLVLVSTIFIIVVVLLARSRARALRQLESLRESTQRGNIIYEEINLPPVDIDTSKNVAYGHVAISVYYYLYFMYTVDLAIIIVIIML